MYMWIVIGVSLLGWINFNFGTPNWWRGQWIRLVLGLLVGVLYAFFGMPALLPGYAWLVLILPLALNAAYSLVEGTATQAFRGFAVCAGLLTAALLAAVVFRSVIPVTRTSALRDLSRASATTRPLSAIDVAHIRLVPIENADWKARKAIGNLGINYEVGELSVQRVGGRLFWVAPLEFRGFWKWLSFKTSPGYILVDAEDPQRPAEVRTGFKLRYLQSAFFFQNLRRHTYMSFGRYWPVEPSFELDDNYRPWFVYSMLRPSIGLGGEKVAGAAIVDPQTGSMQFYPIGKAPAWVDRVIPETTAEKYNVWYGRYVHGFWNSVFTQRDVHQPTGYGDQGADVFGVISSGRFFWFTGHTSPTTRDDSLVGYSMLDAHSGKMTYFMTDHGLLNDTAAVSAVNANVSNYRGWHGAQALFYNLYGAESWVVPVLSEDDKFQGVGIVHARSGQTFFGTTKEEALVNYKQWLATGRQNDVPSQQSQEKTITAAVVRISSANSGSTTLFYFTLAGSDKIFTAHVGNSAEVPLTRAGDTVTIEYMDTAEKVTPVSKFDNSGF